MDKCTKVWKLKVFRYLYIEWIESFDGREKCSHAKPHWLYCWKLQTRFVVIWTNTLLTSNRIVYQSRRLFVIATKANNTVSPNNRQNRKMKLYIIGVGSYWIWSKSISGLLCTHSDILSKWISDWMEIGMCSHVIYYESRSTSRYSNAINIQQTNDKSRFSSYGYWTLLIWSCFCICLKFCSGFFFCSIYFLFYHIILCCVYLFKIQCAFHILFISHAHLCLSNKVEELNRIILTAIGIISTLFFFFPFLGQFTAFVVAFFPFRLTHRILSHCLFLPQHLIGLLRICYFMASNRWIKLKFEVDLFDEIIIEFYCISLSFYRHFWMFITLKRHINIF